MITKTCHVSGKLFEITTEDLEFYAKMEIISQEDLAKLKSREISDCAGLPTLCPDERQRRRLTWRNERKLYSRKCDLCQKTIISIYDKNINIPVYCQDCWWSDKWDAKDFSRDFDFSRPFFEQLNKLMQEVAHISLWNTQSENSEYNNCCFRNRNCYMNFTTDNSEDSFYNSSSDNCQDVADSYEARNCELCYEILDSTNCYDSKFLQNCKTCTNSYFLKNCIGCINCFGCTNIRNKEYYFLNKPYTKEEYNKKISKISLSSYSGLKGLRKKFNKFLLQFPFKYSEIEKSENCTGNYINNSKNVKLGFDVHKTQDSAYVTYLTFSPIENTLDAYAIGGVRNGYEIVGGAGLENSMYIVGIANSPHDSNYCLYCVNNCHHLFGCISLKKSKYCILNKQYTKAEYFKTREKIIKHMKNTGEWGEFFPIELSPFAYNETVAQEYFPLNSPKSELKDQKIFQSSDLGFKYKWKDKISRDFKPATIQSIPEDIKDIDDSICREILACENKECGKNYQVQKPELKFYRKINLPIPRKCPDCRHAERMKLRNQRTLFSRQCAECKTDIQTTFAPDRPEKVLCEECYLKIID